MSAYPILLWLSHHSCWRASFLAFCLGGRPAIYTINIPYISFIYSMYIYNYLHIWRAARNVKNPPANNYVSHMPTHVPSVNHSSSLRILVFPFRALGQWMNFPDLNCRGFEEYWCLHERRYYHNQNRQTHQYCSVPDFWLMWKIGARAKRQMRRFGALAQFNSWMSNLL